MLFSVFSVPLWWNQVLTGDLEGHFGQDLVSQPVDELGGDFFVGHREPARGVGRRRGTDLLLGIPHDVEQHLGGAQIRGSGFVDQLRDDASRTVPLRRRPFSVRVTGLFNPSTSNAARFFRGRPRGLAEGSPFLKRVCSGGLP
jgi:hypothetical protein